MTHIPLVSSYISPPLLAQKPHWLGHRVMQVGTVSQQTKATTFTGELLAQAMTSISQAVYHCWESAQPFLQRASDYLDIAVGYIESNTGVVAASVTGALVLGSAALNANDPIAKHALLALSYIALAFSLLYGCQTGVIPTLF